MFPSSSRKFWWSVYAAFTGFLLGEALQNFYSFPWQFIFGLGGLIVVSLIWSVRIIFDRFASHEAPHVDIWMNFAGIFILALLIGGSMIPNSVGKSLSEFLFHAMYLGIWIGWILYDKYGPKQPKKPRGRRSRKKE